MALDGTRLGDAIYDALKTTLGTVEDATARAAWEAVGQAIVDELTTHAVVTTTITTADGGLQSVGGSPTEPPLANQTLNGTVA